ncbi:MAG: ectonucleotide pyrophosphatase/phosphodiesterase [Sphingomonadales bacterium]|nr:ectonucleotide pyrophosphatase/phosphodiesterase [Sphingomonadales bacterium]
MTRLFRLFMAAALLALAPSAATARPHRAPVTILISIDGFRPDYRTRGATPNLDALAAAGISAAMRPSFPSKTFPNHWTLVTGLRPDRHGIVANRMIDPEGKRPVFTMSTDDPWWWQDATPFWATAETAGIRTATMFWPGSNFAIHGVRPQDWQQFAVAVSNRQRADGVIDWLRRPAADRPKFVTVYFDTVDTAGHDFGPDSPEVTTAAHDVDAAIGRIRAGLAQLHQPANIVVVADHGMAAISPDRVVPLASFADAADYTLVEDGPFATLNAQPGHEATLAAALAKPPAHVQCWPKAAIPARLHYGANPRVPQFLCLADTGWMIARPGARPPHGGTHGFDNDAPDMRALFIAAGPAIRHGGTVPDFDNVDVEPLLRDLLHLPQTPGRDGDDAPFRAFIRR